MADIKGAVSATGGGNASALVAQPRKVEMHRNKTSAFRIALIDLVGTIFEIRNTNVI